MNILLTGASGFIGHHLLRTLEQQGHHITACCRTPDKLLFTAKNTTVHALNFTDMTSVDDWLPLLKKCDAVINCVGIIVESHNQSFQLLHSHVPIALFKAAEHVGVKKVIQMSALGADESAQSAYHLSKKSADDLLKSLSLDWFILQPSIVYGDGAQSMALFHALATLPIHTLIDGGQQQLQPIHISDVTATISQCLKTDTPAQLTLPLVGSSVISFKQLLTHLRQRLGKKPALSISLSGEIAQRTAFLGQYLGEPTLNAENIAMLRRGNTADVAPLTRFMGHPPKDIQQQLLSHSANQAERWHAGLYFLRPLLRLSIAFLWLWSGITALFFFPTEQSYQFLAASGITGNTATITLYSLAITDIILGIGTLISNRIRPLLLFQLSLLVLYTLAISLTLAEFWLHPFGPVLKNIPLLATLLVYLTLEGEKP